MKYDHKIGIIGGGPAGSSIALYLSKMNFDVCIFEKNVFPRETICGEFLSHEVTMILKELDLYEKFLQLNPNKITKFKLFNEGNLIVSTNFEFDAFSLERSAFDNFLLSEAIKKGVKVYQPAEINEIKKNKQGFELYTKDGSHFFVNRLIAAFGKNIAMDKRLDRNHAMDKTGLNGLKFHINNSVANFPLDEIHIYLKDGVYCGVSSPGDDKLTFCYLEKRTINDNNPYNKISKMFKDQNSQGLTYDFNQNTFNDIKKYGIGNIYFGKKELIKDDIFFIGDSAQVIAPLAGDGIGMALETSRLLSHLFYESEKKNWNLGQLESAYESDWNSIFTSRIKFTKFVQNIMFDKFFRDLNILRVGSFPFVVNYFMKKTRKSQTSKVKSQIWFRPERS